MLHIVGVEVEPYDIDIVWRDGITETSETPITPNTSTSPILSSSSSTSSSSAPSSPLNQEEIEGGVLSE
jgi:hypothetical protein